MVVSKVGNSIPAEEWIISQCIILCEFLSGFVRLGGADG
jgi:hypothetical protein